MARAKKKPSFAKQLKEIVNEIPEEQRVFGEKLAAEIEWMAGTLTELKNIVDEQGAVFSIEVFKCSDKIFVKVDINV